MVEFTGVLVCWLEFIPALAAKISLLSLLSGSSAGLVFCRSDSAGPL
jgi:hypothetical protein